MTLHTVGIFSIFVDYTQESTDYKWVYTDVHTTDIPILPTIRNQYICYNTKEENFSLSVF